MDIEDRAAKWARDYDPGPDANPWGYQEADLIIAYLAGSAQTQADYSQHYAR